MQARNTRPLTIDEIPLGDPRLKDFVAVPWKIHHGDPYWTPPLDSDLLGSKVLGTVGLLTPENSYHREAEVTHFVAHRGTELVGRISAAVNHRFNAHYKDKFAFFGFFDVIQDYEVARALLDRARVWGRDRGMRVLRGPGEYSNATHERQGVLVEGFDSPPTVEQTHNPPYYGEFLEKYGFTKAKDYFAYLAPVGTPLNPRLETLARHAAVRRNIETRALVFKNLREEVRLVVDIYNQAWANNWGFLPVTTPEADALAETLRPIIDPGLVRFAYVAGEPAAVFGAFPDPNWALRPRWRFYGDSDSIRIARLLAVRRRIRRMRLIFFGILPEYRRLGIDSMLFLEVKRHAMSKGYVECDISLLLEDNFLVIRAAEFMGGTKYKTWRIYDLPLL
jgi:GNAT superfamily N-acetyltransferase